jgi:hypothetical protein
VAATHFTAGFLHVGLTAIASDYPAGLLGTELAAGKRLFAAGAGASCPFAALLLLACDAPALAPVEVTFTHACIIGCRRWTVERVLNSKPDRKE